MDEAATTTAMESPATDQLFRTLELAEAIFMELPSSQILANLYRVCRQWKAVIEASTPIQQALFFKPIHSTRLRSKPVTHFRYNFNYRSQFDPEIVCLNPILLSLLHDKSDRLSRGRRTCNADASWRRALLSQPELDDLEISVVDDETGRACEVTAPPGGFTMDFVEEHMLDQFPFTFSSCCSLDAMCAWRHVAAKEFLGQIKDDESLPSTSTKYEPPMSPAGLPVRLTPAGLPVRLTPAGLPVRLTPAGLPMRLAPAGLLYKHGRNEPDVEQSGNEGSEVDESGSEGSGDGDVDGDGYEEDEYDE